MPAIVVLRDVSIAKVNTEGHMGHTVYDGVVTLRGKSDGLVFEYAYPFNSFDSVASAVAQAAGMLKTELDALSAATQQVLKPQYTRPSRSE
jgi:hypothetical protein